MEKFKMVAKTFAGLEKVLAEELKQIGAEEIKEERRAVSFVGDKEMMYKANFCLRTALRILKPIAEFNVRKREELYDGAMSVDWTNHLALGKTIAVDSVVHSELFLNSMFVSLKVKDAIVDQFREKTRKRPSVNIEDPDMRINVHLSGEKCTVSLDSSGDSLHKRGYRIAQNEAPISEVLAAGMILLSGWDGKSNFIDPMCGSGTILIEAAMIAYGIPPGMYRKSFGFERWLDFDEELFDEVYNADYEKEFEGEIFGSDISTPNIAIAKVNVKNAGLAKKINLEVKDFAQLNPPFDSGLLMVNPPYGERMMPNAIRGIYSMIGDTLKHKFSGFNAWIISSSIDGFKSVGLKPSEKIALFNGALECSFRKYELFSGSRKQVLSDNN